MAIDQGMQHDAGRQPLGFDQLGRIAGARRRGGGLANGGQRGIGSVAQEFLQPLGLDGALDDAGAAQRTGDRLDQQQPGGGRQVAAAQQGAANAGVGAAHLFGRRSRAAAVKGASGRPSSFSTMSRSERSSSVLQQAQAQRLAHSDGHQRGGIGGADESDEVGIDQRRRILHHGAGDHGTILQQSQEDRARRGRRVQQP